MINKTKQQREEISLSIAEMFELTSKQLRKAKEAILTNDVDLAEEVISIESRVNALDLRIVKNCERFIALHKPVAVDLRFVMAVLKINSELERIADHAYSICKIVIDSEINTSTEILETLQFEKMCDIAASMLGNVEDAFTEKDAKIARKIFKKDKKIDALDKASLELVGAEIKKNNDAITPSLIAFSIVKKLERIGDLIKNIAEETIYYLDAKILKHKDK